MTDQGEQVLDELKKRIRKVVSDVALEYEASEMTFDREAMVYRFIVEDRYYCRTRFAVTITAE